MRIIATSDLHGNLPNITETFDLLLIAGDICPLHDQYYAYQLGWVKNELPIWINSLPFKDENSKVVMTWGNHDFVGERWCAADTEEFNKSTNNRVKILRHDLYEHEVITDKGPDTIKIFGTPYCTIFGTWAFMVNDDVLEKKFSQIPEGIDILISHDSPNTNKLGAILEGKWKSDNTGNAVLAKHIQRIKPKLFVSGHFHSGNHVPEVIDGTLMGNVSYVDEGYKPYYSMLAVNFDENKKEVVV